MLFRSGLVVRTNVLNKVDGRSNGKDSDKVDAADDVKAPDGYKIGFAAKNSTYWVRLNGVDDAIFTGLSSKEVAIEQAIEHSKKMQLAS